MTSVLVTELISRASFAGTNIRHVTREIGIPDETVKNWMQGTAEPTEDEVRRFCEKLNVDIPKLKNKTVEKKETPLDKPAKKQTLIMNTPEVKPANDGFMPAPEPFTKDECEKSNVPTLKESKILRDFTPNKELVPNSLVIGEETKPKKEEKKMEGIKNTAVEVPKTEEKAKRTRTISAKKTGKKQFLSDESEAFVRKSIGLKKSEEITEKAVADAFKSGMASIKQKMDELGRLETDVTKALFATSEKASVDDRLKKLLNAAEEASDEGIEVAITILKKFRK